MHVHCGTLKEGLNYQDDPCAESHVWAAKSPLMAEPKAKGQWDEPAEVMWLVKTQGTDRQVD